MLILAVEDEIDLADLLSYLLRRAGHEVVLAHDGDAAVRLWRSRRPDLILLDIGLPKRSGWDVCRVIRAESSTPIMILSGADTEEDIVRGLDLGASDYMTKPFSPRLLLARVRSTLRHSTAEAGSRGPGLSLTVGDITLDADRSTISRHNRIVRLTRLELRVLQELALHIGQVVSHTDLIQRVWGYRGEASSSLIKGHIRNIRIKLQKLGSTTSIRIVPGVGYLLVVDSL